MYHLRQPWRHVGVNARKRGFTLIEVMIVVAVIALLAAVAMPAYFDSIRKSRRADAIAGINQVSQAQERWRANSPTYSPNLGSGGLLVTPAATTVTQTGAVSWSQFNIPSGYYRLRVSTDATANADRTTYTVLATGIGSQANDNRCTSLTMTLTGGNFAYTSTGTASANQCWNR